MSVPASRLPRLAPALCCLLLAACVSTKEAVGPNRCYPRTNGAQCIAAAPRALSLLADRSPVTVRVDARCEWNPTGVILERGARYRLTVTQELEGWTASARSLAWSDRYRQRWARAPEQPMHALIAAQGREERTFFAVGHGGEFTAASGEELLFFANDWPERYAEDRGCVELQIEKIAP
jgi:hypothetical protein